MKNNKLKQLLSKWQLLIVGVIGIVLAVIIYNVSTSRAALLENDVRVEENSDLTYYLDISYDGKDDEIVMSSDTATAKVNSDYIYIEDKLPEGLTFKEFISSPDGSIGAVQQGDTSKSCIGYVVDGVAGLKYDEATRMISFKIKSLQAGCKISVGLVTTTPKLGTKKRIDFYNTATARENSFSAQSNTVHAFIGKEESTLYKVEYQYSGEIPENAPDLPATSSYPGGQSVTVSNNPTLPGYIFSGWTTADATVENSSFEMPEKNVTFVGRFTKKDTYQVSYTIEGDKPENYIVPDTKSYGADEDVNVDSLAIGEIVNGYKFLGWEAQDIDLSEGIFTMPSKNVEIVGRFELVKYKVTYQFQGTVLPPDAASLLPAEKEYVPGTTVQREQDPQAVGYKFLGWYKSETFEMPENDVVILGEWMQEQGVFAPTITKEITNPKASYQKGEKVNFQITVTNTADFAIKDVIVQETIDKATFIAGDGYKLLNNTYAQIESIAPNSSVIIYAEYIAGDEVIKEISNEAIITGAIAENGYTLDPTKEYKGRADFKVANISLKINKVDEKNQALNGSEFTLYSDSNAKDIISKGLRFDGLAPGVTYYLKETKAPTGYVLLGEILPVTIANDGTISITDYEITTESGIGTVTITNKAINVLPNTGGPGNVPYIVIGLLIIIISVVSILFYVRKGKRKNAKDKK